MNITLSQSDLSLTSWQQLKMMNLKYQYFYGNKLRDSITRYYKSKNAIKIKSYLQVICDH